MKLFETWKHITHKKTHGHQYNCPMCTAIINSRDEGGALPWFLRICRHMKSIHGAQVQGRGVRSKIYVPEA